MTPTARTLAACRRLGWMAGVVERYCHHTRRRNDLFGFADIVAVDDELPGVTLIQCTSGYGGHASARVAKILDECGENAARALAAGNRIEVWAWRKYASGRWDARRVLIYRNDNCTERRELPSYLEELRVADEREMLEELEAKR